VKSTAETKVRILANNIVPNRSDGLKVILQTNKQNIVIT